ncbi:MAG TPA: biotin/lipoyl-containing protein [Thermodesulfobacteriota bacterium]
MAFLVRFGGRALRLDATVRPDGQATVRLTEGETRQALAFEVVRRGGLLAARLPDGRSIEAFVDRREGRVTVWLDGAVYDMELVDERWGARRRGGAAAGDGSQTVRAPMPGKVVKLLVSVGDRVEAGQGVVVVEAMKMENELRAGSAGVVKALPAAEGSAVEAGAALVVLE